MGDQSDQLWFSEQVVQMLVANIRDSLESQLTPEKVSQAFQETSERLAKHLDLPQNALPELVRGQLSALVIDMRLW